MARYSPGYYGRRKARARRRLYLISALVIIAVVVVFVYRPFDKNEGERAKPTANSGTATETENVPAVITEPESESTEPEPPQLAKVAPEPTAESSAAVDVLIGQTMEFINSTPAKIIEARDRLNEALPMPMSTQQRQFLKEQLSALAEKWLFSRSIFTGDRLCGSYKVKSGDQLRNIGRQHKVPYEILMEINNIKRPESLKAGETIKVINGPFHARIYRSSFTMDLFLQNTFVRSFPVGLAKAEFETPTGLWLIRVNGKLITPTWKNPDTGKTYESEDPDYPLGSRWIGLKGLSGAAKDRTGFAIHGTKDRESIGTRSSRGCIRLYNGDVILLYNMVMPGFSQVEVVE